MAPRPIQTLAQRLAQARKARGLTQGQLAQAAGEKQPNISKLERGSILQTSAIGRIADALGVPVKWLELGDGPEPQWDSKTGAIEVPPPSGGAQSRGVVAQLLRLVTPQDEAQEVTWEVILSGAVLPARFSLAVPDDALAPRTPKGSQFLFSTTATPMDGDVVIVRAGNGRAYVRLYFAGSGAEWEARARDPAHASLHSERDGLQLLAAATHRAGGQG